MPPLTNYQREMFCLAIMEGCSNAEAYRRAGYNVSTVGSASTGAGYLLKKSEIRDRIRELQEAAASACIMDVQERKQRLSEIGRGSVLDYLSVGSQSVHLGKDIPNKGSISEVSQEWDADGIQVVNTKVKLHDPIKAIAELNKMEGEYPPSKMEVTGNAGGPIQIEAARDKLLSRLNSLSARAGKEGGGPEPD